VSAFISGMRGTFLYLAQQKNLRRWMETSPEARKLTSRFIAGMSLNDGLRVARELQAQGMLTSLDHLGENVTTDAEAGGARDAYLEALRRIAEGRLPATISMKVTSLGLDISPDLCRDNTDALVRLARDTGTCIEFDMEDATYTDRNLSLVREMQSLYPGHVRAVIQAYLYRSEADIEDLSRRGIPVRLCKGAYREPPTVAWPGKAEVDTNFVKLMKLLFDKGTHPAIATHDEAMIGETLAYVKSRSIRPEEFEFQMLYGVGRQLHSQILSRSYRIRQYVPYGSAWYPYFMRRLAERPANVLFLVKNLAREWKAGSKSRSDR
jgi:proline dehydrogenase